MDFSAILKIVIKSFEQGNIRYALIGGFSMGVWGVSRATMDLDFLVHCDDLKKIDAILLSQGYECRFRSENVSQYVSPVKIFGEIDFLHAFRDISLGMISRAREKEIFGGTLKIKVLKPEDIIGLKIQAVANNPGRESRDYADIEALMELYKSDLDWGLIREYFLMFGQERKFLELKNKYLKC